jgi:hypothetical protein
MSTAESTILTRKEFEIFLMIYAAHVDYIYTAEEENYIKSISTPEDYNKMFELFDNTNDYSCLKIILANKKDHFNSVTDKEYYFNLLKNVFEEDGDYTRIEKSFIDFFERIIDSPQ